METFEVNSQNILFEFIENADFENFKQVIKKQNTGIKFWKLVDKDGNTLLNKTAFYDLEDFCEFIINETKSSLITEENENENEIDVNAELSAYVNTCDDNGFSPLHYAAFRGNIKILRLLLENGANTEKRNSNGLNVMHMAAQGDRVNMLIFFKEKFNMKLNAFDGVLSTPLHWACYMGAENVVDFLVANNVDINARDKDGLTPLHLAVLTGIFCYLIQISR